MQVSKGRNFMHKQNRDRFAKRLNGGVAIIPAAIPTIRTHNMEYTYRQNSNFYYLTGFEEPNSICVIAPSHPKHQFIMFVQPRDRDREIWDGKRVGVDGVIENFGADVAFPISEFDKKIPDYINKTDRIYYTLGNGPFDQKIIGFIKQNRQTRSAKGIGPNTIIDPSEFFAEMRVIKIEEEIRRVRRATEITADAHLAAMRMTRPGMYEYEIVALIESIYHKTEKSYPGYRTILASGQNATILHYIDNNRQIEENDLVLIDSGCEYKYYNGDVTRTFPANGKFTDAQREIYQIVLETQIALINMIKPRITIDKVNKRAIRLLTEGMIKLGLLEGDTNKLIEDKKYQKFYMHSVGHMLGLDVHDVGKTADGDEYRKFEPGMVMTVEPGFYVSTDSQNIDPRYLGIGVRIEDNVLVTESGNEVLTGRIPKTIDEIEQVCAENQT